MCECEGVGDGDDGGGACLIVFYCQLLTKGINSSISTSMVYNQAALYNYWKISQTGKMYIYRSGRVTGLPQIFSFALKSI